MGCPMWVDYVRECGLKIGFLPENTMDFCDTDKYVDCPFYRTLNDIGFHCEYLESCQAYEHFRIHNFTTFVDMAKKWCMSESGPGNCQRYKMRQAGQVPAPEMLPDGSLIEKDGVSEQ